MRLDFELARRVRDPRRQVEPLSVMIGTFLGSYVFAVQPDVARAQAFARRLAARLDLPAEVRRRAAARVQAMLERQQREGGPATRMELTW